MLAFVYKPKKGFEKQAKESFPSLKDSDINYRSDIRNVKWCDTQKFLICVVSTEDMDFRTVNMEDATILADQITFLHGIPVDSYICESKEPYDKVAPNLLY